MNCKICNNNSPLLFTKKVLFKYDVQYFQCDSCKFIQTEKAYWLDEAYKNAINITDTGLLKRNLFFSKTVASMILVCFKQDKIFLDFAGGYGIFTRLMRDYGFDFLWSDVYCQNLLANGFEDLNNKDTKYELATVFEVFEHLEDPIDQIQKLLKLSDSIVFSTQTTNNVNVDGWWYLAPEHGQHISLFSKESLQFIAKKFSVNYYFINGLHIFTPKKINAFKVKLIKMLSNEFVFPLLRRYKHGKIESDRNTLMNRVSS